jgi:hypothetical protein
MLYVSTFMSELQLPRVGTFGFVKEGTTRRVGAHPSHLTRRFNRNPSDGNHPREKRGNILWLSGLTFRVDQYYKRQTVFVWNSPYSILISADP